MYGAKKNNFNVPISNNILFIYFFCNTDLSKVAIPIILCSSVKLILMTYFNLLNFDFFKQLDSTIYKHDWIYFGYIDYNIS